MKQFNLETYLNNPNKKVVTRDGRPVRIICTNRECSPEYHYPIVALVSVEGKEISGMYNEYGEVFGDKFNDLFFADEEEELTEFEKEVKSIFDKSIFFTNDVEKEHTIKEQSQKLLDLARKQLQPEIDDMVKEKYINYIEQFKEAIKEE